ncbi:type III pantothenate kinase [Pseudolysobacter antarcticus]|uniref:Type III pantothenate kinase n=1 Tax=Pseudolysobacter antarcticus TaxID=2511995 RepID=A0A411HG80_9GAMM|nr:type III pantothenate kinase [Pseudolysobacter antarcticus]QBB69489.1 type III pantothenate kinase [Pseudolysobacter antarcticus]
MNTKNLLLDLGNTRLKWALADAAGLHAGAPLTYAEETLAAGLVRRWLDIEKPAHVWAASVAGAAREADLATAVRQRFDCATSFVRCVASACGVHNAYPIADRLGIDRFLGLIALHQTERAPVLLVSCGTALTLDLLASDGRHHGGLIAPSPALMQHALYGNTAQLKAGGDAHWVALADNTDDAVFSGTWFAAVALVERVLAQATNQLDAPVELVLSGGAANELQAALGGLGRIEPELVLRGLSVYAAEHPRR